MHNGPAGDGGGRWGERGQVDNRAMGGRIVSPNVTLLQPQGSLELEGVAVGPDRGRIVPLTPVVASYEATK